MAASMLADMLKVGPPLLTEIIKSMESVKDTEKFVNLVQMLLPEYEKRYHVGAAPSPGFTNSVSTSARSITATGKHGTCPPAAWAVTCL